MEAVGAGASILTFITVAFSVTQSIQTALSAIKDGPGVIRSLTDDIAQLQSVLQRLEKLSFVSVDDTDKSQLELLAEKCHDDLAKLDSRLKSLDVSTSEGQGGRFLRKLKLCFSEKDLDQIRHIVQGHVLHLGLRLDLILAQQVSFTASQSTRGVDLLQQLLQVNQDMIARQTTIMDTFTASGGSPPTSARVTEVDDEEMDCSPDTSLDESINRLMRILERKPCVVESDDSEELLKNIEHLLECIRKDAEPVESEGACQNCQQDVSKELKLMSHIILSSPSMMINQTEATRFWKPAGKQLLISQEPKQKAFETDDGVITVTTAKRLRKAPSEGENENAKNEARSHFLAKLTYTSKSTKMMLRLSVNQGQFLFNSFSSMLPSIVVCNIKSEDSPVFTIAQNGSVQDLLKLIEGGEANIHDHDTDGWSLLHYSVGNLPVLKFLIEQGLDVDEVSSNSKTRGGRSLRTPAHLSLDHGRENYEVLLRAGADISLSVTGWIPVIKILASNDTEDGCIRLEQTIYMSPFAYDTSMHSESHDLIPRVCEGCFHSVDSEPYQARRQIQFLVKQGYNVNGTYRGKTGLHYLMIRAIRMEYTPEYMDLLKVILENGGDPYASDDDGYMASHYAYNASCEADYLLRPSAKGDLWDAALTYFGYDILEARRHYPRMARYTHGYTRRDFENLWHGREGNCPYWNDELWPASEQRDTPPALPSRGKLCEWCRYCVDEPECFYCSVCLSSFEYFCEDDNHEHDRFCPRKQVAVWELQEEDDEVYWELVRFSDRESDYDASSSEDSEDGGTLLQDRFEEVLCDASAEEVS